MAKGRVIDTGSASFPKLIEEGKYYVDKTSYLKELFMSSTSAQAPLFTRPRRFGKTLNMSMVQAFCELNYQNPRDTSYQERLFLDNGRNLAVAGDAYRDLRDQFMGQFPVISISFKGVEGRNYHKAMKNFIAAIAKVYERFKFLENSTKVSRAFKKNFEDRFAFCWNDNNDFYDDAILSKAEVIVGNFLRDLALMLYAEFDRRVLIIVDEYDVPLQKSVVAEEPYYNEMLALFKQICVNTFKEDPEPWLFKGIVTGCLKIAHQSVFTDANNFTTYGMERAPYQTFFGFTKDETERILEDYGLSKWSSEVDRWYDGYRMGNDRMYCPWSVLNFCADALYPKTVPGTIPSPYWVNTSGNDILQLYLEQAVKNDYRDDLERLQKLLHGIPQEITLQEFTTYPNMEKDGVDFDTFLTLLLHTGYLTFADNSPLRGTVLLRIPNFEVREAFVEKLDFLYNNKNSEWVKKAHSLLLLLLAGDAKAARLLINELLGEFISLRDTGQEFFYHGFMQGVLAPVTKFERVVMKSEAEGGDGYADLILYQRRTETAVILEFKKCKNEYNERVKAACEAARQITTRGYVNHFALEDCSTLYGMGIGFGGKRCEICNLGNLATPLSAHSESKESHAPDTE